MATAGGPDIITDGLVFGYDTGYGIANNSTATRFYKGQPSTNNTITAGYTWWGDGSNQSFANKGYVTVTDDSLKYNGYDTRLWTPGSSNNVYLNGSGDISTSDVSTVWTYSCYIKRDDGAPITSLSVYMYYPNSDGLALGTIVSMGNGWYRVSRTRTGSGSYIGLAGFTGFPSSHKYYLSGVMLTKTNQTVPYIPVQSSRSSTQSLIDLKKSTNIDLSNVSFDSIGQPVFDGTSDYIAISNASIPITSEVTLEAVINSTSISTQQNIISRNGPYFMRISASKVRFNILAGGAWLFQPGTTTLLSNTWYHFTMTYDGVNFIGYINGVQEFKTAKTGTVTSNGSLWIGYTPVGGEQAGFIGQIPVAKIYNQALTAEEVKQNFNAYKNRFTI